MLEIAPLAAYALVMCVTPGPNNVMATVNGARFGYRRSLPHILGVLFGHGVQTWLVCVGLGTALASEPTAQAALRVVGLAYLLWLAWRLLSGGQVGAADAGRPIGFLEAALFQAVNPKAWIMATTTASLFLPADLPPALGGLSVVAVVGVVLVPCVSLWALFGTALARFLRSPRTRRAFNGAMASALAATAVMMAV